MDISQETAMKIPAVIAVVLLAGCAASPFDAPYSWVERDPMRSSDPLVIPVIVNRVDGVTSQWPDRALVTPGRHVVTLDVPPRKGFSQATQTDFVLDVAPCTRYYVAARLATPVTQDWTPIVRSTERLGECEAKFNVAGAK
jgi:hypothetical protein